MAESDRNQEFMSHLKKNSMTAHKVFQFLFMNDDASEHNYYRFALLSVLVSWWGVVLILDASKVRLKYTKLKIYYESKENHHRSSSAF
jgi:hypothetical protein